LVCFIVRACCHCVPSTIQIGCRAANRLNFPAMSTHAPAFNPADVPEDATVAIVAARFNAHIVDELLAGCVRRLMEMGFDEEHVTVHRVPGAFELPVGAQAIAETEEYAA